MLAVEQNEAISHKPSACAIVLSQYLPHWARHGQHRLVRSQLGDCSDERYFSSRGNKYYARHTVFYINPTSPSRCKLCCTKVILEHLSIPASIHWMSGGQASGESRRYFYSVKLLCRQSRIRMQSCRFAHS